MKEEQNLHAGHRKRMRERFDKSGFSGFSEHEVLEFLLFSSLPRINTNDIAHKLIQKFGSLENVISADTKSLEQIDKVGEKSSYHLKSCYELHKYLKLSTVKKGCDFSTVKGSYEIIKNCFFNEDTEKFVVFYVSKAKKLMGWEVLAYGSDCCVNVDVKEFVKKASTSKASSVVVAHNHPSGSLNASDTDVKFTENLSVLLDHVQMSLKDHFIITEEGYFSFYEGGYL